MNGARSQNLSALRTTLIVVFFIVTQFLTVFLLARAWHNVHWYFTGPKLDLTDFSQFYQAGQLIVSPRAHQVYDPETQIWWSLGLIYPHIPIKGHFYNQSVPFLYLFCIPYGKLPYNISYVVWCLTTELMALISLIALLRQSLPALPGKNRLIALTICLAFASIPAYLTVWHGQTTFLLVAAMSLAIYFWLKQKDILTGVFLALSTVKPQYILLPFATMLGLGRYKTIAALIITEVILFAAAGCFMGFDTVLMYPKILVTAENSTRFAGVNPHVMASLRGVLSVLMPHKIAMLITTLALFASLIPAALLARKTTRAASKDISTSIAERFLLAFIYTLALVLSPHSHYFDCLLLVIPAALTLEGRLRQGQGDGSIADTTWQAINDSRWYRWWCRTLCFYPLLSWFYNFGLGSMEAEGIAFLLTNIVLAVCAGMIVKELNAKAPI
jgi:hypothetical protein